MNVSAREKENGWYCELDEGASPIIVLDAPYGKDHVWTDVLADGLRETGEVRVFQYDRAGLGMSEAVITPRTPRNKAQELHLLLKAKGITKFYFVGYALSGFTVREYAYLYPGEILGIIMLDCATEDQIEGIDIFLNSVDKSLVKKFKANFKKIDGTFEDIKIGNKQIREIKKYDSLRDIPLTVVSGDYHGFAEISDVYDMAETKGIEMEEQWNEWQENLANLSNNSKHITLNVYSYFRNKTEIRLILEMLGFEVDKKNYVDRPLFFSEGICGDNLPLFRFFAFIADGLGW